MISVDQAIKIVKENVTNTNFKELLPTKNSLGYVLSEDLFSPINMPPFRQSAMDGYAVNTQKLNSYNIVGEVKAGDAINPKLNKGEGVRIFTGAAVPDDANAVVMQEKVERINNTITIKSVIKDQENIRPLGEQIQKEEKALLKGTKLTPSGIGYLLSLGITEVEVFKKPSVGIVVTGNELIESGKPLKHGQIYESNGAMLHSALIELGFNTITLYNTDDNFENTKSVINDSITNNDLVLISGGISVGDYDFVGKALLDLGIKQLFYKVKQKPGKPLFFGKNKDTYVFALPGNPASALSCFYNYVYIALQQLSGNYNAQLIKLKAKVSEPYIKKGDRAQFLKAYYNNGNVEIHTSQASSMLNTFAIANAFVYVPSDKSEIQKNELVDVILIPQL